MDGDEKRKAEERKSISAEVVHAAIRLEGQEELERAPSALAWSGLAAGLSMGFSLLAEGLLRSHLPDAEWRPLLSSLGYALGFVIVILGRQQLFTENTLLPILPLLHRRSSSMLWLVARLWLVVLLTNIVGTTLFAWAMNLPGIVSADAQSAFAAIGEEAIRAGFGTRLLQGIFAGWLIALMVWLLPFAGQSRIVVIVALTYLISLGGFPHIIAGSVEVLYLVAAGELSVGGYLGRYFTPTLIGNILGGVTLVALINHAQVVSKSRRKAG